MHWVATGQTVNKEYDVEYLRELRKRYRRKRPALFKSAQWHFQQDNAPVHNSILVTHYLTINTVPHRPYSPDLAPCDFWLFSKLRGCLGINTVPHRPYSPDLAPCDFWLFSKLRGCRYETIEEMKEGVTKVIDTLTSMGPSRSCWNVTISAMQPEEFTSKGLEFTSKGVEFHVSTINKSAHTKKSGNLFNDPRKCRKTRKH